jgi:hypothetical protein
MDRLERGLNPPGLLFVGDCKMSALKNRLGVVNANHHDLLPLPLTGMTAKEMATWRRAGIAKAQADESEPVVRLNDKKEEVLAPKAMKSNGPVRSKTSQASGSGKNGCW